MLPGKFTYPFSYAPHPLVREAAERLLSRIDSDPLLSAAFAEGKMLGVLMVEDAGSEDGYGFLNAFSGNVTVTDGFGRSRSVNTLDGFVPPIYDLLDPDGTFKVKEAEISALNLEIHRAAKTGRDCEALKARRKELSEWLQKWIFDQFVILNAEGQKRTLTEIFAAKGLLPPGGTGECALPRLLQQAYLSGKRPLAFGEFWYGRSNGPEVRTHGSFYPSCTGKCGPLLEYMLQGLDVEDAPGLNASGWNLEDAIVFEDEYMIVADKPSGMLSVPGRRGGESLLELLQRRSNESAGTTAHNGPSVCPVHRLDQDTSGLMVFARHSSVQTALRSAFEGREVSKTYLARLSAGEKDVPQSGIIELPLGQDYYDRPRQKVDFEDGKRAVTRYEVLRRFADGEILVRFFPETGRTHQLRVHSAHSLGLGRPIKGDRLYGAPGTAAPDTNLCLMAQGISFRHPATGEMMSFSLGMPSWAEE